MVDKNRILKQAAFCKELMDRLDDSIKKAEVHYGTLDRHWVMQNDIVRLRRELLALRELLDPYYREER